MHIASGLNFGREFVLAEGKNQLQTQNMLEGLNFSKTGDHDLLQNGLFVRINEGTKLHILFGFRKFKIHDFFKYPLFQTV